MGTDFMNFGLIRTFLSALRHLPSGGLAGGIPAPPLFLAISSQHQTAFHAPDHHRRINLKSGFL